MIVWTITVMSRKKQTHKKKGAAESGVCGKIPIQVKNLCLAKFSWLAKGLRFPTQCSSTE